MDKEILNNIKNDYAEFWNEDEIWNIDNCYREAHIYGKLIDKYGNGLIKNTNNLWVWLLETDINNYERLFKTSLEETDKNKIINVYVDLENSNIVTCVTLEDKDHFEETHNVLKGKRTIIDFNDRYFNLRYEFFKLSLNYEQKDVVKKLLEEEYIRTYEEIEELYLSRNK